MPKCYLTWIAVRHKSSLREQNNKREAEFVKNIMKVAKLFE